MNIKLTGSTGTGEQILGNWDIFYYQLDEDEYKYNCELGCANKIPFNIRFGSQEGYMVISIENKRVSESTIIDCGFDRPLGAYNDTTDFNGGLYKVAEKMLKGSKIELE